MVEKGENIPHTHRIAIFNHMKKIFGGGGDENYSTKNQGEGHSLSSMSHIKSIKKIILRKGGRKGISAILSSITMD